MFIGTNSKLKDSDADSDGDLMNEGDEVSAMRNSLVADSPEQPDTPSEPSAPNNGESAEDAGSSGGSLYWFSLLLFVFARALKR